MYDHRALAYAYFRVSMGAVFLFYGIGKLAGLGTAALAARFSERFAHTWLPDVLVQGFAQTLPFLEVGVGVLLILGAVYPFTLAATALLVFSLTFGTVVEGDPAGVARNVTYTLVVFVLIFASEYNRYAVGRLAARK
jgi:thiosulfate dehydrogenase (quinone) large subunit